MCEFLCRSRQVPSPVTSINYATGIYDDLRANLDKLSIKSSNDIDRDPNLLCYLRANHAHVIYPRRKTNMHNAQSWDRMWTKARYVGRISAGQRSKGCWVFSGLKISVSFWEWFQGWTCLLCCGDSNVWRHEQVMLWISCKSKVFRRIGISSLAVQALLTRTQHLELPLPVDSKSRELR